MTDDGTRRKEHLGDSDSSRIALGRPVPLESSVHLEECEVCRKRVILKMLSRETDLPGRGEECPPEETWIDLCGEVLPAKQAASARNHASTCEYCAAQLRDAQEMFESEASSFETEFYESLGRREPQAQSLLAQKLVEACQPQQNWFQQALAGFRAFRPLPWAAAAGVAALTYVVAVNLIPIFRTSPDSLLAEAYSQKRTLDLRLPGASYAQLSRDRGGRAIASNIDRPRAAIEADLKIAEGLEDDPDDVALLTSKGVSQLLTWQPTEAIATLNRVEQVKAQDPQVLLYLGMGHYLKAQVDDSKADYATAIEYFSRVLQTRPDDTVALFNRAKALMASGLYSQAIKDWERYLKLDPNGGWAKEAQEDLASAKKKSASSPSGAKPRVPGTWRNSWSPPRWQLWTSALGPMRWTPDFPFESAPATAG